MNANNILNVSDVAKYLKVTPQYVRKIMSENRLNAKRIGKQWVTDDNSVKKYLDKYNVIIEPDDHKRKTDDVPDILALSFFSGAMGLDIGMENGGIKAVLACEFEKHCRMTIEKNNPDIALIGDINKYSTKEMLSFAKIPEDRQIDVIFGGPPCQAFSTAGARRALNDDRGNVFLRFIEVIEEIKPKYVAIENVRGLLSAPYPYKDIKRPVKGGALCVILDRLKAAGYDMSFELYNSANFGAPQVRERVVMLGKLNGEKMPYLTPTHAEHGEYGLPFWRTLGEAIGNMNEEEQHYIEFPEKRLKYYRLLKEGQYWKHLPKELQEEAMGNVLKLGGGKTGFYRKLSNSKPSPTLVTNPTMPATDLCHPTKNRPLSVEEYSRIQEFPDDWEICGPILERYKQIGNAVPIKLGEAIAKTIIDDMDGIRNNEFDGFKFSRYRNTNDTLWNNYMNEILEKERVAQD